MNLKSMHGVFRTKTLLFRMFCLLAGLALTCFLMPSAHAQVVWDSNPPRLSAFEGLEKAPGNISIATDPKGLHGKVYRYDTWNDSSGLKERCESRGTKTLSGTNFRPALGGTYFIGWREMWNPMPIDGSWVAFWQMHGYGAMGEGAPLVLRVLGGNPTLLMQNNVNGTDVNFWHTPLLLNTWNTFVVHVHLAKDNTGWVELWYNGVQQTFINGKTRFNCPTWDSKAGSYNLFKWGVYRSSTLNGKGPASTFMTGAKIGMTFNDANPTN